ncbi:MAG: hypothetical protein E7391_04265 [Ruminococcaceae bacterium]|nr:hypothetical protein [Oscillospiraceae bacterium]
MATYKKNDWLNNDFIDRENASNAEKLPGQTDELYERAHETFKQSDESLDNYETAKESKSNYKEIASKKDIISKDVKDDLNLNFDKPTSVKQADRYLASQLQKIQSGRTSYSDQVRDMMDKIMNREKFSYDVDNDPLFQQALASATNSGKQAMQDTIGQASALTGGYGSTYATSAGNQAYNSFIEDAYDNLPQYYQMALDAYQMEGEEMYRQFGVVSEMDDKEFNRNVAAYDATYQHRNQMYNEAYGEFRDSKNDAFNMANLQLNEHGQRVSDAYNLYNADLSYADSMYEKEYTQWADKVNLAWKETELLYDNAWKNKEFDEGVREFEKQYAQNEDHFTRGQEFTASENQKQRDWQTIESQKDRDFTASENAKSRAASASRGGSGGGSGKPSALTDSQLNKIKEIIKSSHPEDRMEKVYVYLNTIGKENLNEYALQMIDDLMSAETVKDKGKDVINGFKDYLDMFF